MISLDDFELAARERLPHATFEFLAGGAADEHTLRWNREAFANIRLRPRVLADLPSIDTSVTLFGDELPLPLLLAPIGYQRLFHPDGEAETARAGVPYVVSTSSTTTIEEIAAAATAPLWLQLYLQSDRGVTRDLVERATSLGIRALCLTVDTPVLGSRNRQQRAGFALPDGLVTPHLDAQHRLRIHAPTWDDVDWLRSITRLPLLLKGILDPDDAARALDRGADGVIVSNHGARNLDTLPATIEALPHVVARIGDRVPVLLDGGIRRGTDIVKALAHGAAAVLIGRPYAFGLAVHGASGVARVVEILREELTAAMALLGRRGIGELDRSVLW